MVNIPLKTVRGLAKVVFPGIVDFPRCPAVDIAQGKNVM